MATPVKNTGKRGLCYNDALTTTRYSLSGQNSQVSWAYNWNYKEWSSNLNSALQYIPTLWSNDPSLTAPWPTAAQAAINNGAKALFSFNEPDGCWSGSACMNLSSSVAAYKKYMQPFAGKALLGAPAVTNAASSGTNYMGLDYLQYFMGNCTGCHIDFINIHWYSNKWAGINYLMSHVQAARKVAGGRPIWITEYALDNTVSYTDAELYAFMNSSMSWLDAQSDVHGYAYFMNAANILVNSDNSLNTAGKLFNSYPHVATSSAVAKSSSSTTVRKTTTMSRKSSLTTKKVSVTSSVRKSTTTSKTTVTTKNANVAIASPAAATTSKKISTSARTSTTTAARSSLTTSKPLASSSATLKVSAVSVKSTTPTTKQTTTPTTTKTSVALAPTATMKTTSSVRRSTTTASKTTTTAH